MVPERSPCLETPPQYRYMVPDVELCQQDTSLTAGTSASCGTSASRRSTGTPLRETRSGLQDESAKGLLMNMAAMHERIFLSQPASMGRVAWDAARLAMGSRTVASRVKRVWPEHRQGNKSKECHLISDHRSCRREVTTRKSTISSKYGARIDMLPAHWIRSRIHV